MNHPLDSRPAEQSEKAAHLHRQAQLNCDRAEFTAAIALCQQAIKLQPHCAIYYHTLGQIFHSLDKIFPALRCYNKARDLQPELIPPTAYFTLGNSLAQREQLDGAIACYQTALQINPNYPEVYLNLGVIRRKQGNIDAAVTCYRQAIALNPHFALAYFSLGNALMQQKQLDGAIAAYIETLLIQPQFEDAYLQLCYLFFQKGSTESALACALHILPFEEINAFYSGPLLPLKLTSYTHPSPAIEVLPIQPKFYYYLSAPKTFENPIHRYFKWEAYLNPETFVAILNNGRAWGDAHNTAIFTADGGCLDEVSQGSAEAIALSTKLPPPTQIDGTVAFLTVRGGRTYYHWQADLLPRIELLRQSNINFDAIDFFAVNSCDLPFQQDSLQLLGIPPEKIIESTKIPHIKAKKLLVPSLPGQVGLIAKWSSEFLRKTFLPQKATPKLDQPRRLYITRQTASYRQVVNEEEVVKFLSQFGFVKISLESLSFAEQIGLFAVADAIVAPHGAGLTNAVYCQPGTKIIEIFSPTGVSINYWLLANVVGLEYYYLLGGDLDEYYSRSGERRRYYTHPLYEDIWVDISALGKLIKWAEVG